KKIPEVKPDLVILDVYMPGYTGLEVCQKIKDAKQTVSLPVLLTVGKLEPFKARDASRVRADGFIVKPFEATELLATIKRIVGVLPEGAGKKNGLDSKARVKEAKLASQAASAEQLASALKNVLPPDSKFESREETEGYEEPQSRPIATEDEPRMPVADAYQEPASDAEPFSVSGGPDPGEEDVYSEREPDSTKFRVDFDKRERPPERRDESIPFRASTFETWEKANAPTPAEIASREDALARIRAARQNEAEEVREPEVDPDATVVLRRPARPEANSPQETRPAGELDPDATLSLENTTWQAISEAGKPSTPESIQTAPNAQEEMADVPSESEPVAVSEAPAPQVLAGPASAPISGLADWASDLHDTSAAAPAADSPIAAKWIAEEVPLASGDSSLSLSDEMQRFESRASEPSPEPEFNPQHEEVAEPAPIKIAASAFVESPAPEAVEAVADSAAPAASEEQVAALAKAAAAAAISSISEIREAVLASAAAAGVSGSGSDAITVQPQTPYAESASEEAAPDMTQFATQPSTPTTDDIQGATIAAVTREVAEVAETAPADLNSDAIASIVNRVIEQMKPKLVAEIAKELTHKPEK
ncbi:MAG TPA: response regulator, partial [Terriglobales bacterium]|nr:response regulator [Terriglobales bacterium]